jgi:microcystin-dependent protein
MEPFVGEIRMFAGNFAPLGWVTCDGQLLSIAENSTLFQLLGTTFGGDGEVTFGLPDLRGRVPLHIASNLAIGERGGTETVGLTPANLPPHNHTAHAASRGTTLSPAGNYWAADPGENVAPYAAAPDGSIMAGSAIGTQGGSQPHDNMQPFLAVTFIISLYGVFPTPT